MCTHGTCVMCYRVCVSTLRTIRHKLLC
uniref:Uncharacterized protein n=1 Tax=Anopheles minimus TaxID=112268 RepID=A0A182WPZ2_9DIPT